MPVYRNMLWYSGASIYEYSNTAETDRISHAYAYLGSAESNFSGYSCGRLETAPLHCLEEMACLKRHALERPYDDCG